jgi:predicted phosphodiesterase
MELKERFRKWWIKSDRPGRGKCLEEFKNLSAWQVQGYLREFRTTEPLAELKTDKEDLFKRDNEITNDWNGETLIRFGIVSDTHLCNKDQQLTFLNKLYDIFKEQGLDKVYHAGDITDGYYRNRPGHIYELIPGCIGADEQTEYVVKSYPQREGIETYFIDGNHDQTHIVNGGTNISKKIASERPDMKYLGCSNARVYLTPNCTMELNHPLDGASYALSYSTQKYIDSMSGGEKPNILINGHHHKAMYLFYRNIHALEAGTVCAQTPWMRGKRIAAHVGGWIITLWVDKDGTITKFIPEFIPQYTSKKDDY